MDDLVKILRGLETEFIRIGDLAPLLRDQVEGRAKSDSGDAAVDVVTEADFKLQEEYLRLFLGTPLEGCRLWAEESNPILAEMASRFRGDNGLYLCLDPIDGTQRFVENAPYYSSIISLHDGSRPLYSWIYYPKMPWWVRLDFAGIEMSGPGWDEGGLQKDLSKVIVYTAGDPEKDCPDWKKAKVEEGFRFLKSREIGPFGAKYLLIRGKVGGYFVARPNPYDGLLAYHFALLKDWQIKTHPAAASFNALEKDKRGYHYPLAYLISVPT